MAVHLPLRTGTCVGCVPEYSAFYPKRSLYLHLKHNILVTPDGVAQITDYGLARFQHNVQRSSSFYSQGTSIRFALKFLSVLFLIPRPGRWMAPEVSEDPQCLNVIVRSTLESDVYSLGMTIFEIIAGQDPFADMDDVGSIRTHVQRNGRPATPLELEGSPLLRYVPLIDECWKQRPEDRVTIQGVTIKLAQIDSSTLTPQPPNVKRFSSHDVRFPTPNSGKYLTTW